MSVIIVVIVDGHQKYLTCLKREYLLHLLQVIFFCVRTNLLCYATIFFSLETNQMDFGSFTIISFSIY